MKPSPLILGVDIGGTQLRVALIDEAGAIIERASARTKTQAGPRDNLAEIAEIANKIGFARRRGHVRAVGVSAPGPLDSESGTILDIPTLPGWADFPLREAVGELFKLPATLENDGVAAAIGEWKYGAGRGCRHLVYVTVSTGIGGGVIIDGAPLRGRRGMAGHVGHMSLSESGPRCPCGAIGCFEALASGSALGAAARAEGFADAPAVIGAARDGDAAALALVGREAEILGRGFASLAHLFSPERIVMGGGVAKAFDLLEANMLASFRACAMAPFRDIAIVAAARGDNAGLLGAAALAHEIGETPAGGG